MRVAHRRTGNLDLPRRRGGIVAEACLGEARDSVRLFGPMTLITA
jgi:hypothetical protein